MNRLKNVLSSVVVMFVVGVLVYMPFGFVGVSLPGLSDDAGVSVAHAVEYEPIEYTLIEDSLTSTSEDVEVCNYLGDMFKLLIGVAGAISVIVLVIGGIEMVVGASNPQARNDAKDRITSAVIGLIIALGSWLLLNVINPAFVSDCYILSEAEVATEVTSDVPAVKNPTITASPLFIVVEVDGTYDPMTGVIATGYAADDSEIDMTSRIQQPVAGTNFSTNETGEHALFYRVYDDAGNLGTATRIIYVIEEGECIKGVTDSVCVGRLNAL